MVGQHERPLLFVSGPKFTDFLFNARGILVNNVVYRLLISPSAPEIFAVKFKSCPKSRRILDVLCPLKF